MAIKKCKECGKEVSTSAKVCPHCGKKYPTGGFTWPAKIFLIFILLVAIGKFVDNQSSKSGDNSVEVQSRTRERPKTPKTRERPKPPKARERPKPPKTRERPKPPEKIYKEGDTVSVGYTSYAVWRSWWSNRLSNNRYIDNQPDAMFLFVELSVRNDDKKARTIPPFNLIDENGAEYETSSKAWSVDNSIGALDSLNPSVQKRGVIVFDVPTNHTYKLKVSGGYWSAENTLISLSPNQEK